MSWQCLYAVDRGKKGSKLHVLSDAARLPLVVGVSVANINDIEAFKPLVMAIPVIRSRRGSRRQLDKVRVDKAYELDDLRTWLCKRGVIPRIARKGIESSERLGRYRWKIERTLAWIFGCHRLIVRYERHGRLFSAFPTLAATLTYYKKLTKLAT